MKGQYLVISKTSNHAILPALVVSLALLMVFPALAAEAPDPIEEAKTEFMAAESDAAKIIVLRQFLADHPDHEEVGMVLELAISMLTENMDDYQGAVNLAEEQLTRSSDPETQKAIQGAMLDLYSKPAYGHELDNLVTRMYQTSEMKFSLHMKVMEAAAAAEAWSLIDERIDKAYLQATPEAFQSDYPDGDYDTAHIQTAGDNRLGMLKTYAGWAQANLGNLDRAIALYEEADEMIRRNLLGVPDNGLYRFWGQTLVMKDNKSGGLNLLALAQIFSADQEAGELALKIYQEQGNTKASFEDYLWELRQKKGVVLANFSANDYEGKTHSFNDLRGKKATMLAFWFPT
jgi:tetratricopeptide (TPR) repeat protein